MAILIYLLYLCTKHIKKEMENKTNKLIAAHYQLFTINDNGERKLVEETSQEQPFVFITGFGAALDALEEKVIATVLEIGDSKVKVDLNHPLAGNRLNFKGYIIENREATKEEMQTMLNHLNGGGCGGNCGGDCGGCEGGCGHHDHEGGCGHHGHGGEDKGCCGGHCH